MPVIKAFSSATAVLVIESQMKVLLGIKYLVPGLISSVRTLSSRINEAHMGDLIMGACAIVFLLLLEVSWSWFPKFPINSLTKPALL